ncbi:hypothetical protein L6452_06679 [Arctium lappa]|uniref:Uncharacterized protein n=1 Tax=Arctium lappa TaxID=4217 RepID=A0ACB9EJK3_ARCLA|nr:hypothetical protein L6452_06679 [Arctium lappa]
MQYALFLAGGIHILLSCFMCSNLTQKYLYIQSLSLHTAPTPRGNLGSRFQAPFGSHPDYRLTTPTPDPSMAVQWRGGGGTRRDSDTSFCSSHPSSSFSVGANNHCSATASQLPTDPTKATMFLLSTPTSLLSRTSDMKKKHGRKTTTTCQNPFQSHKFYKKSGRTTREGGRTNDGEEAL